MAAAAVMAMRIMIVQQDHHHSHHVVDVEVEVVVDEAVVEGDTKPYVIYESEDHELDAVEEKRPAGSAS